MKKTLIALVVIAAVAAAVALRLASRKGQAAVQGIEEIQAERGVPVDVATVRRDSLVVAREMSGEVFGRRQTNLSSDFARKVDSVLVREGDRVSPGQPLVRFDTRHSADQMARLAQLEEAAANAKRQVARLEPLLAKGAVSESDLDDARTQLAVAEANLRDARLLVRLESPIEGVVTLVTVAPGDAVESGETVVQVATLDSVRVVARVAADAARGIRAGLSAWTVLGSGAGADPVRIGGRVSRAALGADPETRLYEVEAVLGNRRWLLLPGEFVTLSIAAETLPDVLLAPRTAIESDRDVAPGDVQTVYRVGGDRAERRRIRIGAVTGDVVQVLDGLDAGDRVVVFGQNRLRDGARVLLHEVDGVPVENRTPAPSEAGEATP